LKFQLNSNVFYSDGDTTAAIKSGFEAAELQESLVGANFSIEGNTESTEYRMLIPLGYQFEADTLRSIYFNSLDNSVTIDKVIAAYRRAVNTPPLNTSREFVLFPFVVN